MHSLKKKHNLYSNIFKFTDLDKEESTNIAASYIMPILWYHKPRDLYSVLRHSLEYQPVLIVSVGGREPSGYSGHTFLSSDGMLVEYIHWSLTRKKSIFIGALPTRM